MIDYRALIDASPNPYLVLDRALNIATANKAYLAATNRTLDAIVGRWAWDSFPTDPETLRQSIASFERVIATGAPDTMALLRFDIPRPQADGGGFETRYWSITHSPVFGANGEVEYVLQHPIDVTELKRHEERERLRQVETSAALVRSQSGMFDRARSVFETNLGLHEQIERLRTLFSQAPGFMAILRGPDHVFELVNDAYTQLVGNRPCIGRPVREVLPELEGQGVFALLAQVYESGQPYVGSGVRIHLQGEQDRPSEERILNFVYQPIHNAQGEVEAIFVEGMDVTAQFRANEALQGSLTLLRAAERRLAIQLDLADCIRSLTCPDEIIAAAGDFVMQRLGAERVSFSKVEEVDGKHQVLRRWRRKRARGDESAQPLYRLDSNCADEGEQAREEADVAVTLPVGERVSMVLTLESSGGTEWTQADIQMVRQLLERTWAASEAAAAQIALRQERDQSRYIFDTMTEGFALIERDKTVVRMNSAGLQLLHRSERGIAGSRLWNVFPPAVYEQLKALCTKAEKSGGSHMEECEYEQASGAYGYMELRVYAALDDRIAIFFRDVTPRKRAEEELLKEGRRKDEFLAMLAHELRNPLAPIGSAAELLLAKRCDEHLTRQASQIIKRQAQHMTHLVDDLLDVSRVTRGLVELERAPLDVQEIIDGAVEQVTPLIDARRHILGVHPIPEGTIVCGDKERLTQVLSNLLNNAAKYTPEEGRIDLRAVMSGAEVVLEVSDNGIGLQPEFCVRAFDLFAQAERTPDRSTGGLGLGLAFVKSLVELHGGSVSCHSAGLGRGSVFTVCLPRIEDRRAEKRLNEPVQHGRSKIGRSVMVVDDNVDAAEMLALLLQSVGHHVAVEHSASAALKRAKEVLPDVCVLDIGLPDIDGNELARRLRAAPWTKDCVLVAVTGYGQASDKQRAAEAGFDYHLTKPIEIAELTAIVAGSLTDDAPSHDR